MQRQRLYPSRWKVWVLEMKKKDLILKRVYEILEEEYRCRCYECFKLAMKLIEKSMRKK